MKEIWNGRRSEAHVIMSIATQSALMALATVKYIRVFRIITNNPLDGAATVLTATLLPSLYAPYAEPNGLIDTAAICIALIPEQNSEDPTVWVVRCEYASDVLANPLLRPTEVELSFAPYQRAIYLDSNGNTIRNSAGDPYDPPVQIDWNRPVITFKRNEAAVDATLAIAYQDAINQDNWFIFAPKQAKMKSIRAINKYDWISPYAEVTYIVEGNVFGWTMNLLDIGFHVIDANGRKVLARDPVDASPLRTPVLLDGAGKQLAQGGQPVYFKWDVYTVTPFAPLGLP